MSIVKNYVTIHLRLTKVDVFEVASLLMTSLVEYDSPDETEDLNFHVFHMITGINKSRTFIKYKS